jgi:Homeodomain-like domain
VSDPLGDVERATIRRRRAQAAADDAERAWRQAIIRAVRSRPADVTVQQIADRAGVARSWVYQILSEEQSEGDR